MFLLLTTQKEPPAARAASFVDLNGDEDRKSWSLNCALADGTHAAVEKYRAPTQPGGSSPRNYTYRSMPGRGWRGDRRCRQVCRSGSPLDGTPAETVDTWAKDSATNQLALRAAKQAPHQAEEMARSDGKSAEALANYLRVALADAQSSWQLAFTIRTDSFSEFQSHRRFQDLEARGYDLRAIPIFRFDSVVEEPAKRYGVIVDNLLVDALMEDAPKEDALPLLAFALQRLWEQYAASGSMTKVHYDKVGGLQGLIPRHPKIVDSRRQ
jgi:hypothetical protein